MKFVGVTAENKFFFYPIFLVAEYYSNLPYWVENKNSFGKIDYEMILFVRDI